MLFGRTVDIFYDENGAYAKCSYNENETFLNNLFRDIREMPVSDGRYYLKQIIQIYFKRYAYRDFTRFLYANNMYSDEYFKAIVTDEKYKNDLLRISSIICSYDFD